MSRRSISYTLSHSRIPTNSTLQQISTVRFMSWQAELFLIVDPSLLQVLISLIIITSSQWSSSRGEWTSYFHFSIISRRTDSGYVTFPSALMKDYRDLRILQVAIDIFPGLSRSRPQKYSEQSDHMQITSSLGCSKRNVKHPILSLFQSIIQTRKIN